MSCPPPPLSAENSEAAALRLLWDRADFERTISIPYSAGELKLERMRELLRRLDRPDAGMPIIHIAGTKGKGSVAVLLAAALSAAGYRCGVFTSPHLEGVEERIAVDGRPIARAELVELLEAARPPVEAMDRAAAAAGDLAPTFFELTTALALLHFRRCGVDLAILEVGLGGRLDSTNVCRPILSIITSISFDHMQMLGDTLAQIAREKAGIIKPGVPVVSGVIEAEPRDVIRQVARRQGCRLIERDADFRFSYEPPRHLERAAAPGRLDYVGGIAFDNVPLALPGRHQAANAAVAAAAIEELGRLGWKIPEEAIRLAWAELRWPARVEVVARQPAIVIDGAHNAASAAALVASLGESFAVRRRRLIFGTSQDKDAAAMLALFCRVFDEIYFTQYSTNPRATPPDRLHEIAQALPKTQSHGLRASGAVAEPPVPPWHVVPDPRAALRAARSAAAADDLICVAGSLYLAAECRRAIVR